MWSPRGHARWAISWSSSVDGSEGGRRRVVDRRGYTGLFREAGNRPAENVELRRPAGLEVDQEARLHAGRQAIDHAEHARDLLLGEADAACARHGNDFLDCALQQAPSQRSGAQRPDGRAGEPARRGYACQKHELLPQLHLDPIGRAGVHPSVPERAGDPIDTIAGPPVGLADDDDLKGTAPLDHPGCDANGTDRREATDYGAGPRPPVVEAPDRLPSIPYSLHGRFLLGAAPHDRGYVHQRVALHRPDREIRGGARLRPRPGPPRG